MPLDTTCIAGAFHFQRRTEQHQANQTRYATESVPWNARALFAAASQYVACGWPVIPLSGKLAAATWKEFQSRLPSLDELEAWFLASDKTPSGVGIVTGKLSGLVVVDCDSRDAATYWEAERGSSPLVVATGGGGVHYYYALPKDAEIRNRQGLFQRKIDLRGEGGYIVAPPSLHRSGKRYQWQAYDKGATLPVFDVTWLLEAQQERKMLNLGSAKVRNAVSYIKKIIAVSGEGGHNQTFRAACKLRDAGLSQAEALLILSDWNETNASPPWSAQELKHKIHSAYDSPR